MIDGQILQRIEGRFQTALDNAYEELKHGGDPVKAQGYATLALVHQQQLHFRLNRRERNA